MKTVKVARNHVKHVHVELDFETFARLKKRLSKQQTSLSQKMRDLVLSDLEDSKRRPPGA